MRVTIVSIKDISADLIVKWNNWAAPHGQLISPYLRFEFAEIISYARDDVRVAIIEKDNEVIGFFAHHTPRSGIIRPVGAPMSDYQGIIAAPGTQIDISQVIKAAGATATVFDNWHGSISGNTSGARNQDHSVIADLNAGSDAYFADQKAKYKNHFKKTARLCRAAERDFGPVRVELGDVSGEAFSALSNWKQNQYRNTGKLNVFGIDWVQKVLTNLRRREGQEFSGLTASLWFGDKLVAVEFGLVGDNIYHSWFPAYDPEMAKYSPGLLLLQGLFQQAHTRNITRIDLGGGDAHYKKYYASEYVPIAQGQILNKGLAALRIKCWSWGENAAQILPDKAAALPGRLRRRWSQASAFEPRFMHRLANMATSFTL